MIFIFNWQPLRAACFLRILAKTGGVNLFNILGRLHLVCPKLSRMVSILVKRRQICLYTCPGNPAINQTSPLTDSTYAPSTN